MATKHVIWTSKVNTEDYAEYFEEMGYTKENGYSEYEQYQIACDIVNEDYDATCANFDMELDNNIVIVADLGLWNGRQHAYKVIGSNLKNTLQSHVNGMSEIEFYTDGYNYRADEYHHDGTNHYIFRVLKDGVSANKLTDKNVMKYTKSLKKTVNNVYGR